MYELHPPLVRTGLSTLTCSPPLVFDVDTQICNYAEIVDNCERGERVPECTDELRDNSVCREQQQADNLDLPVGRPRPTVCVGLSDETPQF